MIRKGQIYKANNNEMMIEICGKKGEKWLTKVLTDKPGVYNGTHKMSWLTLRKRFTLCS